MAKAIGIDLGTTNSAMAVMQAGEPEIIENKEGRRTTPSVVAVNPKTGERFVGELARRQAITNPENTVYSVKRFIGRRFDDPSVKEDATRVSFKLTAAPSGDVAVSLNDKPQSPPEISAMILRKLKEDAETKLGDKVTKAVITVPAYFDDSQREATKVAGEIAGLEVLRIINEPTAAALAYGLEGKGDQTIAVYDFGGGTFDITILQIGDGVFEVKSTNGDTHLGGDDLDLAIVNWVADEFKSDHGIDLRTDPAALQRLRVESERAKIELSTVTSTELNLPFITADATGPKHLTKSLTRGKLEQLVGSFVERTVGPTKNALKDAGVTAAEIDEVILVGGTTRMPSVIAKVKELFGKDPHQGVNPDEVVAMGAAIQAGVLEGEVKDVLLLDVTPLTMGIETLGGVMTVLIQRNTTIPTSKSEVFSTAADSQQSVEIHVLQGERSMAKENTSIGRFMLDGILPAPRGVPQVEVTFDIDADGILSVSAKDKATNREQHITITGRSGLSQDEIDRAVRDAEDHAEEDRLRREAVETRNAADSSVFAAEKLLQEQGDNVPADARTEAEAVIARLKELLADENSSAQVLASTTNELQTALQKIGQAAYAGAGGPGGPEGPPDGADEGDDDDGETVEGEFREV
ncbi:MAG: molecular chaperone DnaK [Chloroflexi bacterium]|nr:molecular chaperone DnaK [Chloroflexota bacterium]